MLAAGMAEPSPYRAVWDFCENIHRIPDRESLRISLGQQICNLGFDQFVFLSFRSEQSTLWLYSQELPLEAYIEQCWFNFDPIIRRAQNRVTAIHWKTVEWDKPLSKQEHRVLSHLQDIDIQSGVSIPIHGPGRGFSMLSLLRLSAEKETVIHGEMEATLQLLSTHLTSFFQRQCPVNATPRLTSRETDCLSWTARGKTALEIGKILSISERTVRFHLNNTTQKFKVTSKHEAVLRAVEVGALRY